MQEQPTPKREVYYGKYLDLGKTDYINFIVCAQTCGTAFFIQTDFDIQTQSVHVPFPLLPYHMVSSLLSLQEFLSRHWQFSKHS